MAKKQFKAESKRLLDMMIHSIYTNREIFLRELISNASDALDKRHYLSLTDSRYATNQENLKITLDIKKDIYDVHDTTQPLNLLPLDLSLHLMELFLHIVLHILHL